ncbi:MAG: maleylpyruvate isomerase family mycothiol-dependent enzyme [Frankiaceae bacterium]|nr:maleylpyruvate isomerase family mycothiol-dependent enzyme [Frankiaceae bacterium]MBV9369626.1 maleylpyruvate isomerase family mycothiol-dependent enzyme [Frankiales bacterium]
MNKPTGDDIARHYESAHARLAEFARGLSAEQANTPVPGTPGWTVHDVLAHLAAIPTDALAGRITGIPSDEQTATQVADRKDRDIAELLAEWGPNVPTMCDGARADLVPPNLAVDALTHEQDIRGALGAAPALTDEELRWATNLYAFGCGRGLKHAGVPPLAIEATDTDFAFIAGIGEPEAKVRATEFEFFRALSGRRSRAQVAGYDWSGDLAPYLDRFSVFGALADDDVTDA